MTQIMKKTEKTLGLDIGTNSIGWAYIDSKAKNVLGIGTVLFHDSRTKSSSDPIGVSRAVARREARMARRQRDRRLYTYKRIAEFLCEALGVDRINPANDPYMARSKAAKGKVDKHTLGRALLHLRKRRGFASNRKSAKGDEGSSLADKISALQSELDMSKNTLGEFLHSGAIGSKRFRYSDELLPDTYKNLFPTRTMYEDEFEKIKQKNPSAMSAPQWDKLHRMIFYQRPLKPQIVGKCRFYGLEDRASKHLPTTHQFRIYQKLQNLRVIGKEDDFLMPHIQDLFDKLNKQKSYKYSKMKKDLKLAESSRFNMESDKEDAIKGNEVLYKINKMSKDNGIATPNLGIDKWDDIVQKALSEDGDEDYLKKIKEYKLPESLSRGIKDWADVQSASYASVSLKFMRDILPIMQKGLQYHDAVTQLKDENGSPLHHSDFANDGNPIHPLPYYGRILKSSVQKRIVEDKVLLENLEKCNPRAYEEINIGKIPNPTVHVALNQLVKLMNAIVDEYGRPDKINIELSRDLKTGKKQLQEINKEISKNTANKKQLREEYKEHTKSENFSRDTYQKMLFWKELSKGSGMGRICIYCGKCISQNQLFNGETEVDHILPFSWSHDDSSANKTVVHTSCNRKKKGNDIPYESFGEDVFERATAAKLKSSKLWRFSSNARDRFERKIKSIVLKEDIELYGDIKTAWRARQMTDTQYASRQARFILSKSIGSLYEVIPLVGKLTANLRNCWNVWERLQLGDVKTKTRLDNRHHAIDAFVIAMADFKMLQNAARQSSLDNQLPRYKPLPTWAIRQLKDKIGSMVVHEKPDHGVQGVMFSEMAYGQELTEDEKKEYGFDAVVRIPLRKYIEMKLKGSKRKESNSKKRKESFLIRAPNLRQTIDDLIEDKKDIGLTELCKYVYSKTGIRSIRTLTKKNLVAIDSAPYKSYERDEFCAVNIWKVPQMKKEERKFSGKYKYKGLYIPYGVAHRMDELTKNASNYMRETDDVVRDFGKPHPSAKFIMRLYKKDLVALRWDEELRDKLQKNSNSDIPIKPIIIDDCKYIIATINSFSTTTNQLFLGHQYAAQPKSVNISIEILLNNHQMQRCSVSIAGRCMLHKFRG